MVWVLDLLRVVSRIEGQCISEATVKKTILRSDFRALSHGNYSAIS